MMKYWRLSILVGIILVLSIFLTAPLGFDTAMKSEENEVMKKLFEVSYEEHAPIDIDNDTHFEEVATNEGWDGDGSSNDPYIIENYNITANGICIDIQGVSVAFEIRNCFINSTSSDISSGIYISGSSDWSKIYQTIVTGKGTGINIQSTSFFVVEESTVFDCHYSGIWIEGGWSGGVEDCYSYNNGHRGIVLSGVNNKWIIRSEIYNNGLEGILVFNSDEPIVSFSTVYDNQASGIFVQNSHNSTIYENTIYNNSITSPETGIHLFGSHDAVVYDNVIYENIGAGINLWSSDRANILENDIYNNSDHGIEGAFSDNCSITMNDIYDNGFWGGTLPSCGINIGEISGWNIEGNVIYNNTRNGIFLNDVQKINVTGNIITKNTDHGIEGYYARNVSVRGNTIAGNGWNLSTAVLTCGIATAHGYYWNITENVILNNSVSGIHIYTTNFTLVTNNIIYDNDVGVNVTSSWMVRVSGNDIGWNDLNAFHSETNIQVGWNGTDETGNWWHNYTSGDPYPLTNGTHILTFDLFPNISLALNASSHKITETMETGNTMTFEAYAYNPSRYEVYLNDTLHHTDTWDGDDVVVDVDGLPGGWYKVNVFVYHRSQHYLNETAILNVTDSTPPIWTIAPIDQEIDEGDAFSYQVNASDISGLGEWHINDTANFHIDPITGLITNATELAPGTYGLGVTVTDTFGNTLWGSFKVVVISQSTTSTTTTTTTTTTPTSTTTPPPDDMTMILAITIGAGGVVVIIIVIIVVKKKT